MARYKKVNISDAGHKKLLFLYALTDMHMTEIVEAAIDLYAEKKGVTFSGLDGSTDVTIKKLKRKRRKEIDGPEHHTLGH